jgi:hypothetical protein
MDDLNEAIAIIKDCEVTLGCECPYCDRDFGREWDQHHEDCRIGKFLQRWHIIETYKKEN